MAIFALGGCSFSESPKVTVTNLPDTFYQRDGLEEMPRIDYTSMLVADVRDFGANGKDDKDDTEAFSKARDYLLNNGVGPQQGGIIYVPEGIYTFSAPDQTNAYWNLNPTVRPGKNQNDPEFQRISNIHILGEGEKSIIRFLYYGIDQGNDFIQTSSPYVGWYLGGSEEISVRDITFTFYGTTDHRYYYNPARTISSGSDAYVTSGVQFVNVTIDQGAIGIQNQAKVEHVWVVDCNVRNTTADGIAFYGVIDGHAMYNRVENTGDDGIALWANSLVGNQGRDYVVKHNTIYEVRYGRGSLVWAVLCVRLAVHY